MDLAIVTGTGPAELTSIDGLSPYLQPEDVVIFGFRWPEDENPASAAQPRSPMLSLPLTSVRNLGLSSATEQAVSHFAGREFWVHLDADVLAPEWMPAVDSPDSGGMNPNELTAILGIALAAANCAGLEVTIYDPTLDPSGEGASLLVSILKDAMAPA